MEVLLPEMRRQGGDRFGHFLLKILLETQYVRKVT
jgi:hypothetical protein